MSEINFSQVRADFINLNRKIHGRDLVYLDSAATALKPKAVIERVCRYYENEVSNVHRGAHYLAEQGTLAYEGARATVQSFIGAKRIEEIVFTRGTTESINLVAQTYGRRFLRAGDEIILSELEHHSNIVPWQMIAEERGCVIRVVPINDQGELELGEYQKLLNARTKIVAITWCSNALGTINDVKSLIESAHAVGARVLIDAAQAVAQFPIDVSEIDCDFLAFSGHKIFAPFGIGVLYAKAEHLEAMPPYQTGGSMIGQVTWEKTTWAAVPHKFEAGSPNVGGALGLESALRYVSALGFRSMQLHEHDLLQYALQALSGIAGLRILGNPQKRVALLSFVMDGAHASDLGQLLDQQGVAIRAGHHCCQPLMKRLGVAATARASFSIYNTRSDVDALVAGLMKAKEIFQ